MVWRRLALVLCIWCIWCIWAIGFGLERTASAQTSRQERHRVPADYMSFQGAQWLERDERSTEEQPQRVLEAMALEPGDVVADVGCGSGYYARQIAPRVQPRGWVYCEDIQPEMLGIMQQLAREEGVAGIQPVLGTATDPELPAGEVDWVVIADVYHEMSDPEPMLAGIRQALSPGGHVALLEYRVEDGTGDQIKADHTMSVRQVLLEWQAAGFELADLHDFLPSQHLFFFRPTTSQAEGGVLKDYDLFDAVERGVVEAQAVGASKDEVMVRIKRTGDERILVTSPVAAYFRSDDDKRDMIARRDGWIVLDDSDWHDWSLRAVARQHTGGTPGDDDPLEILQPNTAVQLEELMYQIQAGTYTVADSPRLYPPRTHGVEQAAVWIVDANSNYQTIGPRVEDRRVPAQYAVAFALVFCDLAGIDVTDRRVWRDRRDIFRDLRDPGLNAWYQVRAVD